MARLTVPKVPAFVLELCRRGGVRLRKFHNKRALARDLLKGGTDGM